MCLIKGVLMNRNLFVLFTAALFFISAASKTEAKWEQLGGPGGTSVKSVITIGNKLFAGSENGVYLSTDSGSSWRVMNEGLSNDDKRVDVLAANNDYIFAGTPFNGIYRSGISDTCNWEVTKGIPGEPVYSIAFNGSDILAGTYSGKIFISTDNGANWSIKDSSLTEKYPVYSITLKDSLIVVGSQSGLFISTNGGMSWKEPDVYGAYSTIIIDGTIIVANRLGQIYRSTDNGSSWTQIENGLDSARIENFIYDGDTIYGGSFSYSKSEVPGVFKSTDKGLSWIRMDYATMDKNVNSMAFIGNKIIAGTEHDGIFLKGKSDNAWIESNNGMYQSVSCFHVRNGVFYAGTPHGLFLSEDEGKNWSRANSIESNRKISALVSTNNTIYAASETGGVYRSIDNGLTWHITNAFDTTYCLTVSDSFILAGNSQGIQRCRVNDSVWSWVDIDVPSYGILSVAAHDSIAFAGGYFSGAFRSTDYGKTWSTIDSSLPASLTKSFAICGDTVFASLLLKGVYRSIDNGVHWTNVEGLSSWYYYGDLAEIDSIVAVVTDNGIYYTTNIDTTWTLANTGLENNGIFSLFAAENSLYAGTENSGVWYRSVSDLPAPTIDRKVRPKISNSTDFRLLFHGSSKVMATIEFSLEKPTKVNVKVYDMHGREVSSLLNSYFTAGKHSINWNTRNLTSGIYTVRMSTGTKMRVLNMIKIK